MQNLTRSLRVCVLLAFLIAFGATNAHATILGDILTKIDNLKNLMPPVSGAAAFTKMYIKENRLNTARLITQAWRGMADGIIRDIDAATELGLPTAPLMEELNAGPIAVLIIMEDTLTASDLGLTNAVNVLTAHSRYYRNGMRSVNDNLSIIFGTGANMTWYEFYIWMFFDGGIDYYDSVNTQDAYYHGYYEDAILSDSESYLSPYNILDYMMPLSEYYGNINDGLGIDESNHYFFTQIDAWISISFQNAMDQFAYWASQGVTMENGVLQMGPVIVVDERILDLVLNLYTGGYYCMGWYVSPDLGLHWYQSDQVECYILG